MTTEFFRMSFFDLGYCMYVIVSDLGLPLGAVILQEVWAVP